MATERKTAASTGGLGNAFARELRASLRPFLYWLVPVAGLMAMMVALQPSMAGDGGVLAAKIKAMPDALLKAFGIAMFDFKRPAAYLATNFVYVTLTGGLLAAAFGAAAVAREEAHRTAELLFAQPVSRLALLGGKGLAALGCVLAFHGGVAATTLGLFALVTDAPLEPGLVLSLFAGAAALSLCFLGMGMLAATLVRDPRRASGAALGVVLGTWFLGVFSALSPKAETLGWLSPFKRVEPSRILLAGGLDSVETVLLVVVGAACAAAAAFRFVRRDVRA